MNTKCIPLMAVLLVLGWLANAQAQVSETRPGVSLQDSVELLLGKLRHMAQLSLFMGHSSDDRDDRARIVLQLVESLEPLIFSRSAVCYTGACNTRKALLLSCGHLICASCMAQLVRSHSDKREVKCPEIECDAFITAVTRAALDPRPQVLLESIKHLVRKYFPAELLWECPNKECFYMHIGSKKGCCPTCYPCTECGIWHDPEKDCPCTACRDYHSIDKDCSASVALLAAETKACPRCEKRIWKDEGCKHMTCSSCKYEFCWKCGITWKNGHLAVHCGNKKF